MGNEHKFKILNFDLAKGKAGWSLIEYDTTTNSINVIKVGSIMATRAASKVAYRDEVNKYGKDIITFGVLDAEVTKLVKQLNPDYVVAEDAFYKEHIKAYTSLVLCLHVVSNVIKRYGYPLFRIFPTKHKATLTANGHCKKETTIETIKTHPNIQFLSEEDKDNLDEHQADSISVGNAFSLLILPDLLLNETK